VERVLERIVDAERRVAEEGPLCLTPAVGELGRRGETQEVLHGVLVLLDGEAPDPPGDGLHPRTLTRPAGTAAPGAGRPAAGARRRAPCRPTLTDLVPGAPRACEGHQRDHPGEAKGFHGVFLLRPT